jgi:hypothetical protein
MSASKTESASTILKLYELRRDPEMRSAREWYATKFQPKSAQDIVNLLMESFEASRYYRMVTSYWDMAASLVLNGGIERQMFLDANTEHIAVFAKIHPYLAEVRSLFREGYLQHLEGLVMSLPDAEKLLAERKKLLESWQKAAHKGEVGFTITR